VAVLMWSNDREFYGGVSAADGKSPMPNRSKMMTQTKRDTLALQGGGYVWG
jgi:hypothetical protein